MMEISNDSIGRIHMDLEDPDCELCSHRKPAWIERSIVLRDKLGKKPEQKSKGILELMKSYYNVNLEDPQSGSGGPLC